MSVHKIICGKVQDVLFELKTESANLVVADPPYFKVMVKDYKGNKHEWDNQWHSFEEYLRWCELWLSDVYRVLRKNGSAYLFGDDKNIAYTQVLADKLKWCLQNNIIWYKWNNMPIKGWNNFRCFAPVTERILFYARDSSYYDNQLKIEPMIEIRNYLDAERKKAGLTLDKMCSLCNLNEKGHGGVAYHWCSSKQPAMIPREHYLILQKTTGFFMRDYDELLSEFKLSQEEYSKLRRVFNQNENYTDVWKIPIVGGKETNSHPTQKPLRLIERIIGVSSKEGDTILAPFMGSGTDLVAAERLGRDSIGVDSSEENCKYAYYRLKNEVEQTKLSGKLSTIEKDGF